VKHVLLSPAVLNDFDRFFDHLAKVDGVAARERVAEIIQAIQVLSSSPLIGRPVKGGKRELMVGHGAHGYVVLYRFVADIDAVFILAARGQRESGYGPKR
jgi:plasmid stabilization system protein ParE